MVAEGIFAVDLSFALFAYCYPCSELNSPKHDMLAEGCFVADFSCGLFAYYNVFRTVNVLLSSSCVACLLVRAQQLQAEV
jgi:hypothetical protein